MKHTIIFFLIFIIISCAEKRNRQLKNVVNQGSFSRVSADLLWGIKDKVDTSNYYEKALFYLNSSDYKKALLILQRNVRLDTVSVGGFYGIALKKGVNTGLTEKYAIFRLNDYLGNIGENMLANQLLLSFADPTDELFVLQNVEDKYLQIINKGVETANATANDIRGISLKYPDSKRIKYLLAKTYLSAHRLDDAIEIFDFLISQDYYALPSLRALTQYLHAKESILYKNYARIFRNKFPNECLPTEFKRIQLPSSEDSLFAFCKPCITSDFQVDSIYSKLFIAKYYLASRKLHQVDSMYNDFDKNYTSFALDYTLLTERGLYYDLNMRSLFLQGKYKNLCEFVKFKLGYNEIIKIENNQELKQYIQKLFDEYRSSEKESFDTFYTINFTCYFEE